MDDTKSVMQTSSTDKTTEEKPEKSHTILKTILKVFLVIFYVIYSIFKYIIISVITFFKIILWLVFSVLGKTDIAKGFMAGYSNKSLLIDKNKHIEKGDNGIITGQKITDRN